ncbi:MAG: hypothetical protein ACRDE5_08725 [Ginsengibacter sp.]
MKKVKMASMKMFVERLKNSCQGCIQFLSTRRATHGAKIKFVI